MRAAELGMPALAVTDHEGLYGAVRFYQACKAAGIKPIVGVELTVEPAVGPGGRVWEPGADGAGAARRARRRPGGRGGARRAAGGGAPPPPRSPPTAASPTSRRRPRCRPPPPAPPAPAATTSCSSPGTTPAGATSAASSAPPTSSTRASLRWPGSPPSPSTAATSSRSAAAAAARSGRGCSPATRPAPAPRPPSSTRIFGREYFIELQHELLPDSDVSLRALDLLAHELRIPTVATGDVHYTVKGDAGLHDVLAAEAANQPLPNPLGRKNAELYLKSPAQMRRLFQRYPEAYANAGRIAARCNLDLGLGRLLFPAYPLPPGETAFSLLWKRCFEGAAERYRPLTAEVTARLERELKVVEELGFAEYFLAVRDIVEFARGRGIYYSGRGSAGNSIVSYVLRITDADPIAHELLFERFLNPARREMPDVDIDFCSARRDEVIQYIYERFGHDKVAMVATVNTVRAPSAVRIVSRAFGFTPEEINGLSRRVPWGSAAKLGEMLAERPELADHEFQHPHYRRLVDVAERLSGFPAHLGTHLGGFILSRDPLTDRVPLQWAAKGVVVAQFDKDDVETLGLVKMDILALKMHSAIAEAVRRIEARTGEHVSAWELPRDDPKVYELIRSARTVGLFQLESSGQRNLATRLQERDFEDVIAAISLFRPGPLQADMIAPFIRRRHGREPVVVPHPAMERILRRTYGVIVYQEQVIEVAAAVAGFSLAEADMLRRTMTHERSMEEMDDIGRNFVEKAMARGASQEVADEVFRQLRGFAAYGFNKAHAACFAIVCNASAWLKAHYPAEFYAGILNNQPMGFYSPRVVLNDARRFGLEVLPLDVNLSGEWFEVEEDGTALRVGLAYVKEMSAVARRAIVEARARPAGTTLRLVRTSCARTRGGREIAENLRAARRLRRARRAPRGAGRAGAAAVRRRRGRRDARAGACAGARGAAGAGCGAVAHAAPTRPQPPATSGLDQPRLALDEQLGPLTFLPDWSRQRRVSIELELLGLNVSAHPLRFVRDEVEALRVTPMGRLPEVRHGSRVRVAGVLERAQMPWIRSGHRTMFLTLEDETELGQVVVFNDVYLKYGRVLKDAVYLLVDGELQNDEEHGLAVVAHRITDLLRAIGRDETRRPPADRPAGPVRPPGSVPGGLTYQRPDAWELPAVEPRTRPGRTG